MVSVYIRSIINQPVLWQIKKRTEMKSLIKSKLSFAAAVFLAFTMLMPFQAFPQKSGKHSISINRSDDNRTTIKYNNGINNYQIEYEGDIKLSDDDRDIIAISRGGFLEIRKSAFGNRRRILIESDGNGRLIKEYYVGRTKKSFEPEGKEWLSEILPEIIRTTTLGAQARVDRFYKQGGAESVLKEVRSIKSDYVKSAYLKLLLNKDLKPSDLERVIEVSGNEIDSDHYLSSILKENQEAFLVNSNTITAYINATKTIGSDHYKSQVLFKVIDNANIDDGQMGSMLRITQDIDSDHYLSQVLLRVMKKRKLTKGNIQRVIDLTRSIDSDHYKTQVLTNALKNHDLSGEAYNSFLATIDDIGSDHYITQVISALVKKDMTDNHLSDLLSIATRSIQSDHYMTETIKKLVKNNSLTDSQLILVFKACETINSDHYLSSILAALAPKVNSEKTREAYRQTAKTIRSETYYGKAMRALDN